MQKEAMFYEKLDKSFICCFLCAHKCKIKSGKSGFCGVRENRDGTLYTQVYGEVIAQHIDPIEKKPLYHFMPGTSTYSIATAGCNFRCDFCQNWQISQLNCQQNDLYGNKMTPEQIVRTALSERCASISYTYTEPTIYFEYAYDIAVLAKKEGLANIFVTNGYMTKEALVTIQPYLDACNVDLKSSKDDFYRRLCSARLQPVLDTIKLAKEFNIWLEITTLLIPGQNDDVEKISWIADFIASIDREIPWHVTRFFPNFNMQEKDPGPVDILFRAKEIGLKKGLKRVYVGNV